MIMEQHKLYSSGGAVYFNNGDAPSSWEEPANGFLFGQSDSLHDEVNNVTARMRKMTMQEDAAVCQSIISMPKTPYIR